MGILFMISSTFGQNFFGNREEPKITETDFKTLLDGFWEGEGNQLGSKWSMQLYYDARTKYFIVQYPSLSCSGHWEIAKISSKVLALKESITQGTGNCKKNSEVKVRFVSEKEMKIEFYEVNGLIPLATAKIYKKEPLQIENTVFKTLLTEVWEGEVNQIDSKWLIQLQYNSQKDEFTVNYPTLSCSGTWNVNTVTENMIKLNEVITEGGNNCIKEMDIYIYYNNDNTLNVKFHRTDASQHIASGTIQKKDQFTEMKVVKRNPNYDNKSMSGWKTYLLYGKVKQVTYADGGYIVFNQDGNLTKEKDGNLIYEKTYQGKNTYTTNYGDKYEISFDGNERRDLWRSEYEVEGYYYSFDNYGRCIKAWLVSIRDNWSQEYFYKNDDPFPSQLKYENYWEEGSVNRTYNYTYTKFDEQGNWIERKVDETIVDREWDYGLDQEKATTSKKSYNETRTITYYE